MTRHLFPPVAALVSWLLFYCACPVSAGQEADTSLSDVQGQEQQTLDAAGVETDRSLKGIRASVQPVMLNNREQTEEVTQKAQTVSRQRTQQVQASRREDSDPVDPYDSEEAQKKAEAALLRTGPTGPDIVPVISMAEPVVASSDTLVVSSDTSVARESRVQDDSGGLKADVVSLDKAVSDLNAKVTTMAIIVNLQSGVLFDFDKATIKPAAEQALANVALIIREKGTGKVYIDGHTDAMGSKAYNQKLSERRAEAVKNWLVEHGRISKDVLITRGFGETKPVAPNTFDDGTDNPEGRARNRRVEITIPTAQ